MSISLETIKKPIEKELSSFQKHFRESMKSDVYLLDKITYYIIKTKGKQIRPMLVFLCARLFGESNKMSFTAASLIELLHTATLVHDDVVDESYQRRGFFSINALWQKKVAVLVGDYLLAKGLLLSLDNDAHHILRITSNAVKAMSEGELLQIQKARKLDIDEEIYFDIIRKKTASLIAAACSAGAASTAADPEIVEQMRLFGEKLGIAFQIKDDLLDFSIDDTGKPKGIDIQERKMTLPIIHALSKSSFKEKRWAVNIVRKQNTDKAKVAELITFIHEKGGIDYTLKVMENYNEEARVILAGLPDSEAKSALMDLVKFITERKK